jgi:anti-anti-sigma regulatory factor
MDVYRHIACQPEGGLLVVTLLDADIQEEDVVEGLRQELLDASGRFASAKWALDFHKVMQFASAGIRPLLYLHRKMQDRAGRMVFFNLKKELLELFLATRLIGAGPATSTFELAKDLPDALAKLRHYRWTMFKGVLVFTFCEEKLLADALGDELTAGLEEVVTSSGAAKVILDFEKVAMIATPCLRPLLHISNLLKSRGGRVVLAHLSPLLKEVLSVTRMIAPNAATKGLFECYPDTESALKALG